VLAAAFSPPPPLDSTPLSCLLHANDAYCPTPKCKHSSAQSMRSPQRAVPFRSAVFHSVDHSVVVWTMLPLLS
jgi:hypothetical protein